MKTIVIFDLDGTLALIDARREKATNPNGKLNWGVFFDPQNIQLDKPNLPVIAAFSAMKSAGYSVGIFSGRDSIFRKGPMGRRTGARYEPNPGYATSHIASGY